MLADQLGLSRIHGRQLLMECDRNGLIERDVRGGSAGTTRVALTDAGYAAIGKSRSASVPAAQGPPDLSPPRVVEVIEEDDTPLVFKTREQRQQEIRDAQADVQYPRGEP